MNKLSAITNILIGLGILFCLYNGYRPEPLVGMLIGWNVFTGIFY